MLYKWTSSSSSCDLHHEQWLTKMVQIHCSAHLMQNHSNGDNALLKYNLQNALLLLSRVFFVHTHTHTHTRTHTYAHTCMHARAHTNTHTHTHTQSQKRKKFWCTPLLLFWCTNWHLCSTSQNKSKADSVMTSWSQAANLITSTTKKPSATQNTIQYCLKNLCMCHSCQPVLRVNLSPEFVNLYFPYASWVFCFFHLWQQHFEFQPACVAMEGSSNVVRNTHAQLYEFKSHFQWDFLAYCTWPVSVPHFTIGVTFDMAMTCVNWSFDSFSIFLLSLKQQQNLMKIMFSCIHFTLWPYPPKYIYIFLNLLYNRKLYGLTGMMCTLNKC